MDIFAFVLYFVAMVAIGVVFFVKSKSASEKDYFLGGRQMGPWVTAMSAQASDMSAWLLMGLPGSILAFGFGQAWIGIGLAIGTAANWILVAKRLRKFSKASGDAITLPQYLSNRFASKSHTLSIICAVVFLVCFTIYVASAFVAGSDVFTTLVPELTRTNAMLIFAAIVVIYTFLGGFNAVCWTDFFQGLLMLAALLIVPVVVGFTKELDVSALSTVYTGPNGEEFKFVANFFNASWKDILSGLGWGLGYFGMPHILLRFMAIEDPKKLKLSRRVASVWVVISMAVAVLIGVVGYSLMKNGIIPAYADASAAETVIIDISKYIAHYGFIPAFVGGIILAGILASTMSTADSQLLAAASSVSQNLVQETFRVKLSEKKSMWLARISVIIISVIAIFLALDKNSSVFTIVSFAWAGFGATFGPVVLFALFWKRTNKWGALAGMISGGVMIFVWKFLVRTNFAGTILDIYELLPAFIVACVLIVVISLATKAPEKEITDEFDAVKALCK